MACGLVTAVFLAQPLAAEPVEVRTGAFVTSISGLDPADGSARILAYLWFIGPVGALDAEKDLEVLGRSSAVKRIVHQTLPDGQEYQAVEVNAVIDQKFDLADYPFDSQVLRLQIETTHSRHHLVLLADNDQSRVADTVQMPLWTVGALRLEEYAATYDTGFGVPEAKPQFSRLAVLIEVARVRSPLILEKFTGFLVALCLTALSFLAPPQDLGTRVGIMTGSIFAAVTNRYRLEDHIGFDGSFGLVDQVTMLTFSAILFGLMVSLYLRNLRDRWPEAELVRVDRRLGVAVMGVHFLFVLIAFLLALI